MEITELETILLTCPVPEEKAWRSGGISRPAYKGAKADMVIVRVHTDEGITGLGEPSPYAGPRSLEAAIESLEPELVGEDPFDVDVITGVESWYGRQLQGSTRRIALAGINQACWDIMGKAAGQPVYKLLGGQRAEEIPVYASGGNDWRFVTEPERLVREAERYRDDGYRAFKFRISDDERFLRAIDYLHEEVGDEMELIVESNMRFDSASQAIRRGRKFEHVDPYWWEEPLSADDIEGYREIRRALPNVPISGGEMLMSAQAFKPRIERRMYDIVQPDANIIGISETKRVADMANLAGIRCTPHNWHNAVNRAANLHVAAAIENHDLLEMQQTWFAGCPAFREDIVKDPIAPEDGVVEVPDRPGLGVELDESEMEKYAFEDGPMRVSWGDHPF